MRGRGPWLILAGLVAVGAVLVALAQAGPADSPEHRSTSDGRNGTSALRQYAERLGRPSGAVEGEFRLPDRPGLLFVFSPTVPYSSDDVAELLRWVEIGGTLVYAAETGDPRLDAQLGVQRARRPSLGHAQALPELVRGVGSLEGAQVGAALRPGRDQVPILRSPGRVVLLADPGLLTNEHLGRADNWRLASDLVSWAPRGAPAVFDEYHHGDIAAGGGAGWALAPWGDALLWAALLLFAGFALRGRAFGPRLPALPAADRPSSEYVAAVGRLLRRAGARQLTFEVLQHATRRALAERVGVGRPGADLEAALQGRAPALAGRLAGLEQEASLAASSDAGLLEVAAGLHGLAYPSPPKT
jgi:hypothetical protein